MKALNNGALAAASDGLGLNVKLPDYTAVNNKANRLAASIERRTISESEAKKSMGSLMFVKGVADYNAWVETLKKP